MKTALITGVAGQDGSYLAESLFDKGYRVIGIENNAQKFLESGLAEKVELIDWDMLDEKRIKDVLSSYRPQEVYNYAAYSSGEGMFDHPVAIGDVNGLAVVRILEAIYEVDAGIRFCQASSSEMFGETLEYPQSEETLFRPRSPYGAAKLYAHEMIRIYRTHHKLFACSAILFNHESPRRGYGFVTRKVTMEAAKIKRGLSDKIFLGDLDACRDWGFAGDYVRAMWMMLQQDSPDDYVVATGRTHSVRELCEAAFNYLGLDYRKYVEQDLNLCRQSESTRLMGNPKKIRECLGWIPHVDFAQMIKMMVDADLKLVDEQIKLKRGM